MARAKVKCPECGDTIVEVSSLVIDDEAEVYRFTCPECSKVWTKICTEEIRSILRGQNVATIDELVSSGAAALADDARIWRELLSS